MCGCKQPKVIAIQMCAQIRWVPGYESEDQINKSSSGEESAFALKGL